MIIAAQNDEADVREALHERLVTFASLDPDPPTDSSLVAEETPREAEADCALDHGAEDHALVAAHLL